ncbi:MAG: CoA transferase, partial [Hyphomicrobium sp.]|nr:CoA transferase [Hyphomicrobium sp.]
MAEAAGKVPTSGNAGARLPLEGVRVVDIASFLAAPIGAMFLADFGADVVKVERP